MTNSKLKTLFGAVLVSWVTMAGCNLSDEAPPEDASCGDGVVETPEVCDDGNADDGDYCAGNCAAETGSCGDGVTQANEACDDGNTDDGDYCAADCQAVTAVCGDGEKAGDEACDDGNADDGDYCAADCAAETGSCGDGATQANETCDDGNTDDDDYCSADCLTVTGACGNALVEPNEGCDDGNTDDGDYCAGDCSGFTGRCADLTVQSNEVCDDGNNDDGDYCAGDCQTAFGACGDDILQDFEVCDDGNAADDDYCAGDCQSVTGSCGDAMVQSNEACDDGDNEDGDYCSSDCLTVTGECGDGVLQDGEECDDANDVDDDLCTSACVRVPFRYDTDLIIDTPTTWPAGVDITFAAGTTLTISSELTVSEGVLLTMGSGSLIEVVSGGTLMIQGTEDYPVSVNDESLTSRCGSWAGLDVSNSTFFARHLIYQRASQGIRVSDGTVVVEDTRILDTCAPPPSGSGSGSSATGLGIIRSTATVRRLVVDGVAASAPSGDTGFNGSYARGISFDKSVILALEDLAIASVEASGGTRGVDIPFSSQNGGSGGLGGTATGLRIRNRTDDETTPLVVSRVRIDEVFAGGGRRGGHGADGADGISANDFFVSTPGGSGGHGGDGGNGGDAFGVDIDDDGDLTLSNVLATRIGGAGAGRGGNGGDGGRGGNGFFSGAGVKQPSPGGDAGSGGDTGIPGTTLGLRVSAPHVVIEHATVREILAATLSTPGSAGSPGLGGTLFGNSAPSGRSTIGGQQQTNDESPAGVQLLMSSIVGATDPIVRFSVFSASPAAFGIVALNGATVMSDFNLFDELAGAYENVSAGINDLIAAPLFVNATSRDFTPSLASPLYDAATGSTATVDVYGNPRDAAPDIGAIENVPVAP